MENQIKDLADKLNTRMDEAIKDKASLEQLESLKTDVISSQAKESEKLTEILKAQGVTLEGLKEIAGNSEQKTIQKAVQEHLSKNMDELKNIKKNGYGIMSFNLVNKAVGAMTTGSTTNPDGIPNIEGIMHNPPNNVGLEAAFIDGVVNLSRTNQPSLRYTESTPKEGGFALVAEGGTKPQIDMKFETRNAKVSKAAAHKVITDEALQDIPQLQSICTDYLRKKHDLFRQDRILFGDGTGENPFGSTHLTGTPAADDVSRVFAAGGMANKINTPNFMDVVNACITDIYTTRNYTDQIPYTPNLVLVNPIDFYTELVSGKDADLRNLFPTASLFNVVNIGGITIRPYINIPAGKIHVADMRQYNVANYIDYNVAIGFINDQFITNQMTIRAESRFHTWVESLKRGANGAFIYDDIATIKSAIAI